MNLSIQLRAWRDSRKETQREAAASLGVPLKTYIDWEQGRRRPQGLALFTVQAAIAPGGKVTIFPLPKEPAFKAKTKSRAIEYWAAKKRKKK